MPSIGLLVAADGRTSVLPLFAIDALAVGGLALATIVLVVYLRGGRPGRRAGKLVNLAFDLLRDWLTWSRRGSRHRRGTHHHCAGCPRRRPQ